LSLPSWYIGHQFHFIMKAGGVTLLSLLACVRGDAFATLSGLTKMNTVVPRATDPKLAGPLRSAAPARADLPRKVPALPTIEQYRKFALPCLALWVAGTLRLVCLEVNLQELEIKCLSTLVHFDTDFPSTVPLSSSLPRSPLELCRYYICGPIGVSL
jgi:hypothetical protein